MLDAIHRVLQAKFGQDCLILKQSPVPADGHTYYLDLKVTRPIKLATEVDGSDHYQCDPDALMYGKVRGSVALIEKQLAVDRIKD